MDELMKFKVYETYIREHLKHDATFGDIGKMFKIKAKEVEEIVKELQHRRQR